MDEKFKKNCVSRTATSISGIGYDGINFSKWISFCDRDYKTMKYFDLLASV